ncbi:MAG: SAM-dependent chlorinase/fluorinase [Dehalococcoidia bacterium]|nr:SAM-dependent chlorinase/fluorinase [Dehalococcoidia bacterium]
MAQLTRPIVFLTDFGTRDQYAGQVKSVIATIAPAAPVIDLTHDVEPYAIDEGAWILETSLAVIPPNAVVLAVVDPGVGTARRGIAVASGGRIFVGPDNGLLSCAFSESARRGGTLAGAEVRLLDNATFHRPVVSSTFHARDIFGPTAAHLAAGEDFRRCGSPCDSAVLFPMFEGVPAGQGTLRGSVVHIDRYGNLVTTIRARQLFPACVIQVAGVTVDQRVRTFGDARPGVPFCHADSSGFVAIALREASAAAALGVSRGAAVEVHAR